MDQAMCQLLHLRIIELSVSGSYCFLLSIGVYIKLVVADKLHVQISLSFFVMVKKDNNNILFFKNPEMDT